MPHKSIDELMTSYPRTVDASTSVATAARIMRDEDVGSVPVVEGDILTGMLTDRDIVLRVVAEGKDPESTRAGDVASREIVTIDPQGSLDEAIRLMERNQIRRLPVTEEDGRLVGILAQADVARHADERDAGEMVEKISQ
jgi:CBS domain-containing protein